MRLLLDQDVYEVTARFLSDLGHDVLRVAEVGMSTASDEENLRKAVELERLFITRDRDFGNLVFVRRMNVGVLYLRMLPSNKNAVHEQLTKIFESYAPSDLSKAFVVVEAGRYRFRTL